MAWFRLERLIEAPLEKVWAAADFTKSAGPFPMEVKKEGDPDAYGKGFERVVINGKRRVLERLETVDPMRSYRYSLIGGVPVKPGYVGRVELTPKGNATQLTWTGTFIPLIPGTGGLISKLIQQSITQIIDVIESTSKQAEQ